MAVALGGGRRDPSSWPTMMAGLEAMLRPWIRGLRAAGVITLVALIGLPNLPPAWLGEPLGAVVSAVAARLRSVSVMQRWKMYAPNPQRAQSYMTITAHYADGRTRELQETEQARSGWTTQFAWNKTREDIWRHYANFRPTRANDHRKWYLRGVCVREARRGPVPKKLVMEQVTRRFTPPQRVAAGAPDLGPPRTRFITVAYCQVKHVHEIIEADRARRLGS